MKSKRSDFYIKREKIEKVALKLLIFFGVLLIIFHFTERYRTDIQNLRVVVGIPNSYMKDFSAEILQKLVLVKKLDDEKPKKGDIFVFNFEKEDYKKLKTFLNKFPGTRIFFLGKPPKIDVREFTELLDKNKVVLGIMEFDDSTGFLNWVAKNRRRKDLIFRVHRIKDKEYESLNLDLQMALSRWKRAVLERSIDLLYITPPPEKFGISYQKYVELILEKLSRYATTDLRLVGYRRIGFSVHIAIICGFLLFLSYSPLFTLIYIFTFLWNISTNSHFTLLASYVGIIGPVAVFATINRKIKTPIWKLLFYPFLAILVGYIVNSMLSEAVFLNQIFLFRGVKLSLITLPGLVMLKELLDPENKVIKTKLSRVDLLIAIIVILGAFYYILRSGNTSLALNFERRFRDFLERIFLTRPRFKELIGYPFLFVYVFGHRKLLKRYSFLVPVIGSVGIVSTVNTFCHIRAPLWLSTLRSVEGIGIGYMLGSLLNHFLKGSGNKKGEEKLLT